MACANTPAIASVRGFSPMIQRVALLTAVEIEVARQARDVEREQRHEDVGDEAHRRLFVGGYACAGAPSSDCTIPVAGEHHTESKGCARVPVHAEIAHEHELAGGDQRLAGFRCRCRLCVNLPREPAPSRSFAAGRDSAARSCASSVTGCANGSAAGAPNADSSSSSASNATADAASSRDAQALEQHGR